MILFIIWERFASNRKNINALNLATSIEWLQLYPPAEHRYSELPILSNF